MEPRILRIREVESADPSEQGDHLSIAELGGVPEADQAECAGCWLAHPRDR